MANARLVPTLLLSLVVVSTAACEFLTKETSPTAPSSGSGSSSGSTSLKLDSFAGAWASPAITTPNPTSCANLNYTVTPVTTSSANVSFSATCAGNVQVSGTGTGTLSGSALNWNAQGTITQGGLTCPFVFPSGQNTAVPEGSAMRVNYNGTICGLPVAGSELVNKK